MLLQSHFFSLSQSVTLICSQVQTAHLSGSDVLVSPICNYFFPQSSCQRGNRLERAESEQCRKKTLGAREAWVWMWALPLSSMTLGKLLKISLTDQQFSEKKGQELISRDAPRTGSCIDAYSAQYSTWLNNGILKTTLTLCHKEKYNMNKEVNREFIRKTNLDSP